jgi:hypothetical protein
VDQIAANSPQALLQPVNGITCLLACSRPANEQNRKENKQLVMNLNRCINNLWPTLIQIYKLPATCKWTK